MTETPETVAALVPLLLMVTACVPVEPPTAVRAKARLAGLALSTGPGAMPLPDSVTVSVTPPALTVRLPVRAPDAVGLKVTFTVQEPLAAMDDPQLLVCAKSPLVAIEDTAAAEPVGFDTVTVCAALVAPVATEPKFSEPGLVVTLLAGYGGKTSVGLSLRHEVGLMPELPPPSVTAKALPSQL